MSFFNKKDVSEKEEERFILCLDGGGMRGIIPSVILEKLSSLLKENGDTKPFYSHFDLIAGTSTGGLLALALTTPTMYINMDKEEGPDELITFETPEQTFIEKLKRIPKPHAKDPQLIPRGTDSSKLISIYKEKGKKIFPSQTRLFGQILKAKYDSKPLETFLKELFGDSKLSQCLVPTMAVSYELQQGIPYCFKSWDSKDFYTREAARATSAAPTYFPPAILHDRTNDEKITLVDGAMIANNPVVYAYGEAKKLYPNCKKFHIISLSTASPMYFLGDSQLSGGLMDWIDPSKGAPIQKIYASSQMQLADYMAETNDEIEYSRVDFQFEDDKFKLDDTSSFATSKLEESGNIVFSKNETLIKAFIEKLVKREDFSQVTKLEVIENESKKVLKEYIEESYLIPPFEEEFPDLKSEVLPEKVIASAMNTSVKRKIGLQSTLAFLKKRKNPVIPKLAPSLIEDKKEPLQEPLEKVSEQEYQNILDKYGLNDLLNEDKED